MLHEDAQYFPAFRVSQSYISLLAELDLLRDCESTTAEDSEFSYRSICNQSFIQNTIFSAVSLSSEDRSKSLSPSPVRIKIFSLNFHCTCTAN